MEYNFLKVVNHYILHLEQIIMHSNCTLIKCFLIRKKINIRKKIKLKLMPLASRHLKLTKQNFKWNDHHSLSNISIPDCDKPCWCSGFGSKKTMFQKKSKTCGMLKNTLLALECLVAVCHSLAVFKELHSSTFNSEQVKYMT